MRQKSSGYIHDIFAWQGFNRMKTQAQLGKGFPVHSEKNEKEKKESEEDWVVHNWANNGMI